MQKMSIFGHWMRARGRLIGGISLENGSRSRSIGVTLSQSDMTTTSRMVKDGWANKLAMQRVGCAISAIGSVSCDI